MKPLWNHFDTSRKPVMMKLRTQDPCLYYPTTQLCAWSTYPYILSVHWPTCEYVVCRFWATQFKSKGPCHREKKREREIERAVLVGLERNRLARAKNQPNHHNVGNYWHRDEVVIVWNLWDPSADHRSQPNCPRAPPMTLKITTAVKDGQLQTNTCERETMPRCCPVNSCVPRKSKGKVIIRFLCCPWRPFQLHVGKNI